MASVSTPCETRIGGGPDRFVYSVVFFSAPLPESPRQKLFLFSSLAAIYEVFSAEQIGVGLGHLYNLKVPDGTAFAGRQCIIRRERVISKRHRCREFRETPINA